MRGAGRTTKLAGLAVAMAAAAALVPGCGDGGGGGGAPRDTSTALACDCGTIVVAAVGEPPSVLPPLAVETVGRDVGDLVFERLADLAPGGVPIDTAAYRPRLAARWERVDSRAWRFRLRPGARWHDGRPVTAADVAFSFEAYADTTIAALAQPYVAGRMTATAEDSATVLVRFAESYPEQLYDATYHVRVLPSHVWSAVPRGRWAADTALARLVGSGPYRVREWRRGESLLLERTAADLKSAPRRVLWRFGGDPDAALNLLLSHEADVLETLGAPDRVARVSGDSTFRLERYPAAVYGFLAHGVADAQGRAHPVLGDRRVRRALAMAVDRPTLAQAVFGAGTLAPPGPMSRLLWIWSDSIRVLPWDTVAAAAALDSAGWLRPDAGGVRLKGGRPLAFEILVPSTSPPRRNLAMALQETWRRVGVDARVTAVDFAVFQQRLGQGRFDAYIGAYLDEPSPRGLAEQWTRAGIGQLNHGRWVHPGFDSLLAAAAAERDPARAKARYVEAMDTLNADAPAIFLYTPVQTAAVHRRIGNVAIDPYAWIGRLPEWTIDPRQLVARDTLR